MHNSVTGELVQVLVSPADTDGQRGEADLWLQPGAAVIGEHTHSALDETFTVVEGEVGFRRDGRESIARAGDTVDVPAGARHDWWNAGDGLANVRVELESTDPTRRMAERFVSMIELTFGLAATGNTNAKGMPTPLWLAALAHEYRDVIRLTRPPAPVQTIIFGPLSLLARRLGRDPLAPSMHGEACPARIPAPDDAERERLLRRPAGAAAA